MENKDKPQERHQTASDGNIWPQNYSQYLEYCRESAEKIDEKREEDTTNQQDTKIAKS